MNKEVTPKEKAILALCARGLTAEDIADELEHRANAVAICLEKNLIQDWM